MLFGRTTRLRLDPKKLYMANVAAVEELLKVTTILYRAYHSSHNEEEEGADFVLTSKTGNLKAHKQLAVEINELGTKLFDMVGN
jgi:clusterin-associated protein 1